MSGSTCTHCGLPLGDAPQIERDAAGHLFCCHGCAGVYRLLHDEGLGDYYRLRESFGGKAQRVKDAGDEVSPDFVHLDDPELLARVGEAPGEAQLQLSGLNCAACVWLIERLPERIEGFESARVDLGRGRIQLRWDPERIRLSAIAQLLRRLGYEAHVEDAQAQRARERADRRELLRLAVVGACAGNVMLLAFGLHAGYLQGIEADYARFFEWAAMLIALPTVTYGAWPFYRGVIAALRMGRLHLDLPISLGIAASYLGSVWAVFASASPGERSYFDSVTALVFLLLVGRWIQSRSQQRATSRWSLLQRLLPQGARRLHVDGRLESVPTSALRVGQRIEIREGEALPVDARVIAGEGRVDRAALTGESAVHRVERGDEVLAGSWLRSGTLHAEVTRIGEATRVGGLARTIDAAGLDRAPIARLVDRISGWFALAVVSVATVAGLVWWQIDPARSFDVVVSILVISCPCALGLATPMALLVARARAADRGFSILGDGSFERLAEIRHIVFDKTGTLTHAHPRASSEDEGLVRFAPEVAALEGGLAHPVSAALLGWAQPQLERPIPRVEGREIEAGRGVQGRVGAHALRIGTPAWLGVESDPRWAGRLDAIVARGMSPVALEVDGEVQGMWAIGQTLREDAAATLAALRARGLSLSIASGDHPRVVERLGRELGIEAVGAMTPEAKIAWVREHAPCAMVGDGVNDAAAMRAADVGIAVGDAGQVASSVADLRFADGTQLAELPELIDGARATLGLIKRNLGISLAYNLIFGAAAIGGLVNPLFAAIAMPLSSLSVIALSAVGGGFRHAPGASKRAHAPQQSLPAQADALCREKALPRAIFD